MSNSLTDRQFIATSKEVSRIYNVSMDEDTYYDVLDLMKKRDEKRAKMRERYYLQKEEKGLGSRRINRGTKIWEPQCILEILPSEGKLNAPQNVVFQIPDIPKS